MAAAPSQTEAAGATASRPRRIGVLTHEPFHPPSGGGSAEVVYLVRELVRRGHEVHVFCPAFPDSAAVAAKNGVTVHPFTGWEMGRYTARRNLKYALYPWALSRHVRRGLDELRRARGAEWRFDVLLAQHTISAVAAGRLRRSLGVPVVLNLLDYLTGFMETWPGWITATGVVRALNRYEMSLPRRCGVEAVLTVSQPLADRFAATGFPRERIHPIQYGYDAALFRPADAPAAAGAAPELVMHGSFDQHHLGRIAREAVIALARSRPELGFRFVGRETDGLRRFVADVRAAVPGVRLSCDGFVPYAEVAARLRSATVGIVPYEESNGTHCAFVAKAVEYLGCGLPVVSTPLENLRSYFRGEAAIRFSGFDGASFAREVAAWLDTPPAERFRVGRAAAERVARELDWSAIARTAVDVVESVALSVER